MDFSSPQDKLVNTSVFQHQELIDHLKEAGRWTKFLAIVGYIMSGFLLLGALGMIAGSATMSRNAPMPLPLGALGAVYVILSLINVLPCMYMHNYSRKMNTAIETESIDVMTEALKNLKLLFRFAGIMTIIILALYAILFLVLIVGVASKL